MGKCARCGKDAFLFKNFKLKDGEICKKCFRALGFDKSYDLITESYSYDEIKDGLDEMYRKKNEEKKARKIALSNLTEEESKILMKALGIRAGMNDGQKELNANQEECSIFSKLSAMFKECGGNQEDLKFVRYSDNYLSARIKDIDLARFRFGERTQWIFFPSVESRKERHKIKAPEDVLQFEELVRKSFEEIKRYL